MGKGLKKEFKKKFDMPKWCSQIKYFQGYDKPLCESSVWDMTPHNYLYYWGNNGKLNFCEAYPRDSQNPIRIILSKDDIITFTMIGEVIAHDSVSGGGVSAGGALVGAALMGPAGAVIGGKKKVKTTTTTEDNRKTVLTFKENGVQKTIFIGPQIYEFLCQYCIEKKDYVVPSKSTENANENISPDIPGQIEKLSDLFKKGILTEQEFNSKKAELLARI